MIHGSIYIFARLSWSYHIIDISAFWLTLRLKGVIKFNITFQYRLLSSKGRQIIENNAFVNQNWLCDVNWNFRFFERIFCAVLKTFRLPCEWSLQTLFFWIYWVYCCIWTLKYTCVACCVETSLSERERFVIFLLQVRDILTDLVKLIVSVIRSCSLPLLL